MHAYRDPGGAPAPAAAAPPVSICRACGVVAPEKGSACTVCKASLAETRAAVRDPAGDTFWVAIRCGFPCNSCRFLAPLDSLAADGAAECAHCGLRQRFDAVEWQAGLAFAHAVGDLAGPSPEGRNPHPSLWIGSENPFARVGDTAALEHRAPSDGGRLDIEAAPGHPVCKKCHVPLSVSLPAPGAALTTCGTCGAQASYALSDAERALSDAVVAVVADEHLQDRRHAQATTNAAGVTVLACPSCGAPLSLAGGGRVASCTFCKTTCLVPARAAPREGGAPAPAVWWILFRGPSAKRRELEAPTTAAPSAAAALTFLKGGPSTEPIGDAPGVYDAPEVSGVYWPQVGLTVLLGSAAVALGFAIYEVFF